MVRFESNIVKIGRGQKMVTIKWGQGEFDVA